MTRLVGFLPGGEVRKIYEPEDRVRFGALPGRASKIEVVAEGPRLGDFLVDLSSLGQGYEYCLIETFPAYENAVKAEIAWLERHWVGHSD